MKRAIILTAAIVAFAGGMFARDYVNEAHATNVGTPRATLAGIGAGTSAQLGAALTDEVGSCSTGFIMCSASPTVTGKLGVSGAVAVTGVTTLVGGLVGVTGLFTSTSGTALTVVGQGVANGGLFTSGASSGSVAQAGVKGVAGHSTHVGVRGEGGLSSYGVYGIGNGGVAIGWLGEGGNTNADGAGGLGMGTGSGGEFTGGGTAGSAGAYGIGGSGGGFGVKGVGTGVYAGGTFEAAATNGGAAINLTGDATSPQYALIRVFSVGDNYPTAPAELGNLSLVSINGVALWVFATATTPAWNAVSGVGPVTTGVTAFAGGGQASATAVCTLAGTFVVGTVATAGDSVKLPATPVVGQLCEIVNADGTDAMDLFPGSGDTLCVAGSGCLAADAATSITATQRMRRCRAQSTSVWNCQ